MKNIWAIVLVVILIIVFGVYLFSFQVRETENVVVTRFGKPVRTISEPGWYPRWPKPVNVIHKYDSRAKLYQGIMEETTTRGGDPIIVTSYMIWNIAEPQKFLEAVRNEDEAEIQLRSLLRNAQNSVIGQHYFSEFVNSDPDKIHFEKIESEILGAVKDKAMAEYGIGVRMVGIKQLGVSESVTDDVFERMRADRKVKADLYLSQGKAEATNIKTEAETRKEKLLTFVEAQAKAIRGAGDAEAARYYKMLEEEPDFAIFLRNLDALKNVLREKSTIVLDAESEPVELLNKLPEIKPKSSN
jgi:membrane protease subunit HflC